MAKADLAAISGVASKAAPAKKATKKPAAKRRPKPKPNKPVATPEPAKTWAERHTREWLYIDSEVLAAAKAKAAEEGRRGISSKVNELLAEWVAE